MEMLLSILNQSNASDYIIRQTNTVSQEVFFIGQKLDMGRAKNVTHTNVTVYVDSEDKKFRGSASIEVHPTSTKEEIQKQIDKALLAASFVKNPWYPVVENNKFEGTDIDVNLTEELVKITKAMQVVQTKEHEKLNSYEIFVNKTKTHIINSKGVDVTMSNFDCQIEVVINTSKDGHEIELIKDFKFANKNAEETTKDVEAMFISGNARLQAVPTKQNEHANVLLTGDDLPYFYSYFVSHVNATNKFMGIAKGNLDEKMTGDDADHLTIITKPVLNGSTKNNTYDNDGNIIKEKVLFENGVCKSYWGSVQHAHYIQLDDPTSINNSIVEGGRMTLEEMKQQPYLEVTDFSAFIMDNVSGNFGGEIRLGYEFDGKELHSVAGGSISANFDNVLKNIKFSKETKQMNNYIVPCAVLLTDVSVAGE